MVFDYLNAIIELAFSFLFSYLKKEKEFRCITDNTTTPTSKQIKEESRSGHSPRQLYWYFGLGRENYNSNSMESSFIFEISYTANYTISIFNISNSDLFYINMWKLYFPFTSEGQICVVYTFTVTLFYVYYFTYSDLKHTLSLMFIFTSFTQQYFAIFICNLVTLPVFLTGFYKHYSSYLYVCFIDNVFVCLSKAFVFTAVYNILTIF